MNEPWLIVDTGKMYFVTAVNDDSKIVTCFLPENKKELLGRITHIFSVENVHGHMQTKSAFSVIKRQR